MLRPRRFFSPRYPFRRGFNYRHRLRILRMPFWSLVTVSLLSIVTLIVLKLGFLILPVLLLVWIFGALF